MIMRRYLLALAVAVTGCVMFTACNDDDDNIDVTVPQAYNLALTGMYPSVSNVEWDSYPPYYVADCDIQGQDCDVWFGPNAAVWAMTETDLGMSPSVLPYIVAQAFNTTDFANGMIEDIEFFERSDVNFYVIEVEMPDGADYDVYITEDGTVTQAIPDTDAVIYPMTPIGL